MAVKPEPLDALSAVNLTVDSFISAAERDIFTGDNLEVYTIRSIGFTKETVYLRRD